jgi:hypothetical protein
VATNRSPCATYIATYEQVRHADIRSCESPSILCDDERLAS